MKTFDFTVSMKVVNITASEIMNITYSNAFCVAVAQSMETKTSYVAFQSYSQLKRRLLSAATILDLVFSISLPIYWYSNSSVPFNASEVKPRLISNYIAAVDAGDTLRYVLQELLKSGISASFLILPIHNPTESRSPSPSPSNTPLYIFVAAVVGGALLALVCIGWAYIHVRRRTRKAIEINYRPAFEPLVDEEMSMGSIYSSPRSDGENGFFSITNDTRLMRSGEEQKDLELSITNPELVFDLHTMEVVDSSINIISTKADISSVPKGGNGWGGNGGGINTARNLDASSFDSPVSVSASSLGQGREERTPGATYDVPKRRPSYRRYTPSATRFAHPTLPSRLAAAWARSVRIVELPRPEEIPIVEVFKSADIIQASSLSPKMRFRLMKLKFELKSEENW